MPPWIILKEWAEVAPAKSSRSTKATERPRRAASNAAAAPNMPPPITTRSNSVRARAAGLRCMCRFSARCGAHRCELLGQDFYVLAIKNEAYAEEQLEQRRSRKPHIIERVFPKYVKLQRHDLNVDE